MKTVYQKSNEIETVSLSRFSHKEYNDFLKSSETSRNREKNAQALIDYLCDKFKVSKATVRVAEGAQPHSISSGRLQRKVFGNYRPKSELITLYNLTAVKKQTVSIKVMAETLLHEFMHHYDFTVLKFDNSLHTAGFYKRITDLQNKLK